MDLTGSEWLAVATTVPTLALLEGLLSADNALVLAAMVRHLPAERRARALRYGIWGAFGFRFLAVLLSGRILDFWPFEVLGGVYLLSLALVRLGRRQRRRSRTEPGPGRGFWGTVVGVELADLAFSVDSILAAVAVAEALPGRLHELGIGVFTVEQWVIFAGGVLGIIAMRLVACSFLALLDRFRGLAAAAYYLVGWIGLNLTCGGLHQALRGRGPAVPSWAFWAGMGLIVLAGLLREPRPRGEGVRGHQGAARRHAAARYAPESSTRLRG